MITIDSEFQSLIPALSAEEYGQLEENILHDGIRDALIVWDGILLDGHNRYEIAQKHNLPYEVQEMNFDSREDAKIWVIKNQLGRRNLLDYVKVELTVGKLEPLIAAKAKEKQIATLKQNQSTVLPTLAERAIDTREEIAKAAGVSHGTVAKVKKIMQAAPPEVKEAARNGEMSINQAYQATRREEKKAEVQKRIEEYAEVQTGVIDIEKPEKKYNIIYADPPWRYWESGNKNQSEHYKTMTIDDICNLPIKDIAADDSVLFLWVTYPILAEAFRVIESWGFKYSTAAFVWVKKNKAADSPFFGCGAWTRANSELCLLATRGSVQRLDATISQIVESPIGEHSKKPDIVRELIERLVGKLPRVELFCRNPADGWDVWGNEA